MWNTNINVMISSASACDLSMSTLFYECELHCYNCINSAVCLFVTGIYLYLSVLKNGSVKKRGILLKMPRFLLTNHCWKWLRLWYAGGSDCICNSVFIVVNFIFDSTVHISCLSDTFSYFVICYSIWPVFRAVLFTFNIVFYICDILLVIARAICWLQITVPKATPSWATLTK